MICICYTIVRVCLMFGDVRKVILLKIWWHNVKRVSATGLAEQKKKYVFYHHCKVDVFVALFWLSLYIFHIGSLCYKDRMFLYVRFAINYAYNNDIINWKHIFLSWQSSDEFFFNSRLLYIHLYTYMNVTYNINIAFSYMSTIYFVRWS